ncbi:MAG: DNA polymerase IV [Desulfovibrionales bacterium]|nr:DNA polymerase IV [Desulfovibrionales bacterium]
MHVDMDAFFASIEQADNPDLRGKPVVIGQSLRGVASAASYEARRYGIHSAMPIVQARKLCPHAVFLPGRMARYKEVSHQIMGIIHSLCPVVEQASVDEAYADITGTGRISGPPEVLARRLKEKISTGTGLTCSVGIAPNKFLAKIASDWNKPDGLTVILPEEVPSFLSRLPLSKIPGVGHRTLEELSRLGVTVVSDILRHPRQFWIDRFGKRGLFLHDRALGIDHSPVEPEGDSKSCSAENTFSQDTLDPEILKRWLLIQAERVGRKLRSTRKKGTCISLKLKFNDFAVLTKAVSLHEPTHRTRDIFNATCALLAEQRLVKPVRLIGTCVSNFRAEQHRLPLFPDAESAKQDLLDQAIDQIRDRFGSRSILRAEAAATPESVQDLLSKKNCKSGGK